MAIIGYARVSTQDQRLDLQTDALIKYGAETIFEEKITGTKADRPQLNEMLKYARKGDTIVVWRLDRLGRSLQDLLTLVSGFSKRGINFVSLNESIDTTTATGTLIFHIFASMAEFERTVISERTRAGLEAAKARGHLAGRPKADRDKIKVALKMYDSREYSIPDIVKTVGISKSTFYRYVYKRQGAGE